MKRKFYYPVLAATTLMMAAACSQDELVENGASGNEVDVTFTANLEGAASTRAISDGLTVDELIFEVYDEDGNRIDKLRQEGIAVANHAATVNVRLVKGQTYQFVFWAQKSGQTFYTVEDLKNIEVSYTSAANDEERDAFYHYEGKTHVTGSFSKNITLKRPFAQLNLGTTVEDLAAAETAGVVITQSNVKVTGAVYTSLSTFDGAVSSPATTSFTLAAIPRETEDLIIRDDLNQFENDNYKYLSTNYLLAPADGELSTELVFTLVDGNDETINTLNVTNAPLQRNWRTNIVGDILTGEGTFNIVIDPIYDNDYNYEMDGDSLDIWDGTSTQPELVEGVYQIDEASDLVYIASQTATTWDNASFILLKDLSFKRVDAPNDKEVNKKDDTTPATIEPLFKEGNGVSNITFNGNNHVIRDFVIKGETDKDQASLFGGVVTGKINNLTIINADVTGAESADAYTGIVVAKTFGTVVLDNVIVKDSKLKGTQKVGALIGFVAEDNLLASNCTVDGVEISNHVIDEESGSTGGLIGCLAYNGESRITNCWVKNSTLTTTQALNEAKRANSEFIGVIRGSAVVNITNSGVSGNTFTNSIEWEAYNDPFIGGREGSAVAIIDGKTYSPVASGEALEEALTSNTENINVVLSEDLTYDVDAWSANSMGGNSTKTITIDGQGKYTLTFNQLNSDWSNIVTADGAKLILKDVTINNSGYNENVAWNRYDMNFACEVEMNNVVAERAIALKNNAVLNNVTIKEANDNYAIWIQANGQNVTVDGCTIESAGRGIKIDEQYVTPSHVTLNVSDTKFTTVKKSAIIVKSAAGAQINLSNVDITGVTADKVNAVWVDADGAQYADLVTVNGGTKVVEPKN